MAITGEIIVRAGERKQRVAAARARIEQRNTPEAREANRLRHELIHRDDHLMPLNEALTRQGRAQAEVDRLALRVQQYGEIALETGRVSDALAHASILLDAAKRVLVKAEDAVAAERAKLVPSPVTMQKGHGR